MYERFTDRARKVMQLANQEAQRFNHEYIGTEHILLGLVKEGSGVAANVLKNLDIDLRKIRLEVEKIVQHGPGGEQVVMGRLPHTPRARKVIDYSLEEARRLKHNYVGSEHLLLGMLREEEGVAAQVLIYLGLDLERARSEVTRLVGSSRSQAAQPAIAPVPVAPSAPAALTDEERRAIEQRINRLEEDKEVFVAAQNFEDAARCRSELAGLKTLLAWYNWFRRFP
jgi:ATP-dependent Clp protease ATP-binding subunit ClpA